MMFPSYFMGSWGRSTLLKNNFYGGHFQEFSCTTFRTQSWNKNDWTRTVTDVVRRNINYDYSDRAINYGGSRPNQDLDSLWSQPHWGYDREQPRNYTNANNWQYGTNYRNNVRNYNRSPKKFYCNFCNYHCFSFFQKKNHENQQHKQVGCEFCNKIFRVKHELYIHRLRCTEKPNNEEPPKTEMVCARPQLAVAPAAELQQPQAPDLKEPEVKIEAKSEPEENNLNCSYCIKTFPTQDALKKHVVRVHTGGSSEVTVERTRTPKSSSGPFHCPFCSQRFLVRRQLYFHMKGVHTAVFYCHVCPAEFKSKKKLNRHVYHEHVSNEVMT